MLLAIILSLFAVNARADTLIQSGQSCPGAVTYWNGSWYCTDSVAQATGAVVAVTSTSLAVAIPMTASYVGVATATAVLRGLRPVLYLWVVSFSNAAAALRTYTCRMSQNGVPLSESTRAQQVPSTSDLGTNSGHTLLPSSAAGPMSLSLLCRTDNATGVQSAGTPHLTVMEF